MSDDIDIGQISEALNDKMDRDAGNPATLGKERVVGWGIPDYSAGVSKTWNTDITAEASGLVIAHDYAQQSSAIQAIVNGNTLPFNDIAHSGALSISFPVCKGDIWKVFGGDNYTRSLVFYPYRGEET